MRDQEVLAGGARCQMGVRPGLLEQDQYRFGLPVGISIYREREWKRQTTITTKSIIIRRGYAVLSQSFGFLRRVRGDNYCALRASLYQALMRTTKLPGWLKQKSILLVCRSLLHSFTPANSSCPQTPMT
ncbi:ubiquitin thioesterase otulin-like [Alosa sapidissima]|uniref:ubiquitin thioesterase otulin-like n=1 Tax=Alosa sapidissima TaxID=34773 RepID=UPI001C09216A|nr:ubiquitin thioesterase otulin-like [Alosa sapidissima]